MKLIPVEQTPEYEIGALKEKLRHAEETADRVHSRKLFLSPYGPDDTLRMLVELLVKANADLLATRLDLANTQLAATIAARAVELAEEARQEAINALAAAWKDAQ